MNAKYVKKILYMYDFKKRRKSKWQSIKTYTNWEREEEGEKEEKFVAIYFVILCKN